MSAADTAIAEAPAEPVPLAPEAIAELEAAPPQAAPAAQVAERTLPFDVDHLGLLRRSVLDHLLDTEGPQSVAQIVASMPPGTTRGSAESAIKREYDAGRIERVGAGLYVLGKPKPPNQPKPAPPDPVHNDQWFAWLDEWRASDQWKGPGNPPGQAGCLVPMDIISKFNDRVRKREQRRKEADEAAAKRAAADAELRARLLATCNGNYLPGPGLDDMTPIKAILELVPVDYILYAIRQKVDKRCFPGNPPLASWRDPKFLRAVADNYCGGVVIPSMVAAWEAAGKASASKTHESSQPAGDMPDDIDELRSHHDNPHAPPGPHSLPKPPAASAAPGVTGKGPGRSVCVAFE